MQNLKLVREFRKDVIKEDLPDCLYHYTSIEGFKGIIDKKEIWATSADSLHNDPTEITIAKTIARKILDEKDFSGKDELYNKCKESIENSDRSKEFQCICSFSEEENLLSQWRAYCPTGGVSIGFSMPRIGDNKQYLEIKDGLHHNDYYAHETYCYKCIYDLQEQEQKMRKLFDSLLERTENIGLLGGFFGKMIQTFSYTFKHKSFEEEKEWRLCCFALDDQLKYRTKHSMLIPYLPFLIVDHKDCSIIKKIMIGPSSDKEKLRKSVSSFLKDSRISVPVEVTDTPYQP